MSKYKPRPKVAAAGLGGAGGGALAIWVLGLFGVEMDAYAAAELAAVIGFLAGYFKKA